MIPLNPSQIITLYFFVKIVNFEAGRSFRVRVREGPMEFKWHFEGKNQVEVTRKHEGEFYGFS